ncbi:hypothetical protein [Streptomyces sp. SudanB182_2057]|uniref:hypothetical protein n=1 Tax=Streptomyces sp. SudanB182_2057 TaxID=3035281 RepID=UPI003F55DA2E
MTPDRLRLASDCSAALGALVKADSVDVDACAALARRLREDGIAATMHADYLRSETQERALGPDASTEDVRHMLGALKVALFIVSTWRWDMQAEYTLGQILAVLERVIKEPPSYWTESLIAQSRRDAVESLDLHHVNLLSLLDQRKGPGN